MNFTWIKRAALAAALGASGLSGTHAFAQAGLSAPSFTSSYTPASIGSGSTSSVEFTITNPNASPVTGLAFTHTFPSVPGPVLIANEAASTTCQGAVLSAPQNTATVSFADGTVPALGSCTITVDVTASSAGSYTDPSSGLTSANASPSLLSPGALTVVTSRPGFTKSVAPTSVSYNSTATLTYTIDNTANAARVGNLDFTETLPGGIVVASPSNATTDCVSTGLPDTTLTAVSGSDTISLDADGSTFFPGFEVLSDGATCEVSVDIVASALGTQTLTSGDLLSDFTSAGASTATLTVTAPTGGAIFSKDFVESQIDPLGQATLDFTISNRSRDYATTDLAFTDDLNAMLSGAVFDSVTSNTCGGTLTGAGTGTIGYSGGSVAAATDCTISTLVNFPGSAAAGTYTNTTSALTGTLNGLPSTFNIATSKINVAAATLPDLQITFLTDPVAAGSSTTLRYVIANADATQTLTSVSFQDELTTFLPFPLSVTLPTISSADCGAGASASFIFPDTDRQAISFTGGTIAPASSCTFDVDIDIPADLAGGTYVNTTGDLSALVGSTPISVPGGSDTLTVNGGVSWNFGKSFTPSSVAAGSNFTVEYSISSDASSTVDVTGAAFTADIGTLPAGTTYSALSNTCGGTAALSSGDTALSLSGATIAPGASCTISAQVNVPAGATAGSYNTNTSNLTGSVSGLVISKPSPITNVDIYSFDPAGFTRSIAPNTLFPGQTATLTYTLQNSDPTNNIDITFFTENLATALAGLAATGPATTDTCGGSLSGTTFLIYVGGAIPAGGSCTIEVDVLVPVGAADGDYRTTTSSISTSIAGVATVIDPLIATFSVNSNALILSKSFTNDPVASGGTVALEFEIENSSTSPASNIDFTDDLSAMLSGALLDSISANSCGGTPTGTGTGTLSFSGGSVAASSSCLLTAQVTVPGGALPGNYTNTTSTLSGTIDGFAVFADAATDNLEVSGSSAPAFSKSFSGQTAPGETVTLTFTITNTDASTSLSNLAFTDDLSAVLSGLVASSLPSTPCGAGSSITGSSSLSFTDGSLAPSGSCTFDVTLQVPAGAAAGNYVNSTSSLFSAGTALVAPATASLDIVPPPVFTMAFGPTSIAQGANSTLLFTIDNTANTLTAASLDYTLTLPANVAVATTPNAATTCTGGTLTSVAGSSTVAYTGGSLAGGATCTISLDVSSATIGNYPTTTGDLTSSLGNSGTATDTLSVTAAPIPAFSKAYGSSTIAQGATTTLTFTIDNTALVPATNLDFTDTMPTGSLVATVPNVVSSCTGGTVTATAGTNVISYTGGSVAAASQCQIAVDVVGNAALSATNTTGDLTSSLGNSGTATAAFTVTAAPVPTFTKAFSPSAVDQGQETTLTFTIDNTGSLVAATALDFTDPLPAGITIATDSANASSTCVGGTLTATEGGTSIAYSGGSLAPTSLCTISVDILATGTSSVTNTTGDLTSSLGNSGTATAALALTAATPPAFTKVFSPDAIAQGDTTTLTFTLDNSTNFIDATNVSLTDNFPSGMEVASSPAASTTCTGGTLTADAGTTTVTYSGGTILASASCTISLDVTATAGGSLVNTTEDLITDIGNSGTATDTLDVTAAPVLDFAAAFVPNTITQGETSTLTLSLENTGSFVDATSVAVSGTLPSGVTFATTPNLSNTCSGTATATGTTLSLSGGALAVSSTCEVSVDVTSTTVASNSFTSGDLTSSLGNSGTASAALDVTAAPTPQLSYSFAPDTIEQEQVSTLTFLIDNTSAFIDFSPVTFSYDLPSGLQIADTPNITTTCSGTSTTGAAAGTTFAASGGTVAALSSCEVSVDVTAGAISSIDAASGSLTSWGGTVASGSVTLTVVAATTGTLTIVQNADTDGTFTYTSATPDLNFAIVTASGSGQFGPIRLTAGTYDVTQIRPDGSGNASLVCDDADSTADPVTGAITINLAPLENVTCTFQSVASRQQTVDTINEFLSRRADLILANEPSNGRRIDRLRRGYDTATRVSYADGDLKALNPFNFDLTTIGSGNYSFATSLNAIDNSVAQAGLAFGGSDAEGWVENRRWDIWAEGTWQKFEGGTASSGHFGLLSLGADYVLNQDTLVGAMLQIDDMDNADSAAGSSTSGTGWMVGPYVTKRLSEALYFDGRIAYGQSRNTVSPLGTYSDDFDGERWLARAQITGDFQRGNWTIQPNATLAYFQEMQRSYTDSLGVAIPSQTVGLGQFRFGPTFKGNFIGANGRAYQPSFSLDAIYNFGDTWGTTVTNPNAPETQGWRGRLKAGLNFTTAGGTTIGLSGTYDGIGRDDYEAWGVAFDINIPTGRPNAR
ncbi:autotransporter outer membrane beta-barrel domain-containing protein [Shimia haliotis]|uniref:Conserved repeat domain-containing protein n=1 Tax=Shimia haliotis TaxID=1280847 RepID=A0A1I4EYU3_9RHOB|nr:autotransporter outer membrane beta-barrel domain-containing protein [Shimia haliotis]SFL10834.1 conserved repeat domain-containing protein [Shimia haliotis]